MERRLQKSPLPWREGMEGRGIKIASPPPLPCGVKSSTPQGKPSPIKGEGGCNGESI